MTRKEKFFVFIVCILVLTLSTKRADADIPRPKSIGFQDPATNFIERLIDFHHDLFTVLIIATTIVVYMFVVTVFFFRDTKSLYPPFEFLYNTRLELLWTLFPTWSLFAILIPSFAALYSVDAFLTPITTIKIVGNQWYWTYEYVDFRFPVTASVVIWSSLGTGMMDQLKSTWSILRFLRSDTPDVNNCLLGDVTIWFFLAAYQPSHMLADLVKRHIIELNEEKEFCEVPENCVGHAMTLFDEIALLHASRYIVQDLSKEDPAFMDILIAKCLCVDKDLADVFGLRDFLWGVAGPISTEVAHAGFMYSSVMIPDEDVEASNGKQFRLLDTDNPLVLPERVPVRLLITSEDVIHSWAVPSWGVKVDACPGRLSSVIVTLKRPGVFYGQCSEICGVNHGFMPIHVKVVSLEEFIDFLDKNV